MHPAEFYRTLAVDRSLADVVGFNPYYAVLSGLRQGRPEVNGRPCFDLASNDYLGLTSDVRVHEAMAGAVREYGSSMCGTPIATGHARVLAELEAALSRFVGLEAAIVFPSCYQANCAVFAAVATSADVILVDQHAHASLVQGIRAVGCKIRPFRHNDLDHLAEQLAASTKFRQRFIVTESVFSTEGSVAPLDAIVALGRLHDAIVVVDDSHGIGVLGPGGRGIPEAKGVLDFDGIYTASLGKALANVGGMVAGRRDLIDALRYSCAGLIYSTALPPACVAGVLAVLEIVRKEFDRLGGSMWTNHQRLASRLQSHGFRLKAGAAPIASLCCGPALETLGRARDFFGQGLLGTPFIPPSVPEGDGVLRLIVGAKLDEPALAAVLEAVDRVANLAQR